MPERTDLLRVALAQINPTVGDIRGNARKISDYTARARDEGAALVVFPELALTGYPPEDLLLKTGFLDAARVALGELASQTHGIVALVGYPERAEDVYNTAAVLADGEVVATYRKMYLPNYGVFDEQRYFQSGAEAAIFELNGIPIGLSICEDIWEPGPPAMTEALAGAQVIVNLSASPYRAGVGARRERMLVQRAVDNLTAVVFVNTVGGQDELVFDGHSLAIDQDGELIARAPQFQEALTFCTIDPRAITAARLRDTRHRANVRRQRRTAAIAEPPVFTLASVATEPLDDAEVVSGELAGTVEGDAEVYAALRTGLHDYAEKNGFRQVVIALSGGIDSALAALIAVDALGPERVTCVSMPSPYSSEGTRADARTIAENLGVDFREIGIEGVMGAYDEILREAFEGREPDVTEENLQARIRGNVVMALSNKFGWLVLATGNKSELSVGYATLYGDMAGGFAVLKDVLKTQVYSLTRWRNERAGRELVPASVLERPPSAELRAEQRDDQSLPPYDVLDKILEGYVEEDLDAIELVHRGLPAAEVERVIRMVDRAEYKRRQAPPGIKISTKAFGRDRRLPITNRHETTTDPTERRLRALT
ncbi:MAG TPA: NAD+ synthase [Thermoleophilaceae bacterium]|nr:NAD+ synthase [Thermoleophilaceae bacterium]